MARISDSFAFLLADVGAMSLEYITLMFNAEEYAPALLKPCKTIVRLA